MVIYLRRGYIFPFGRDDAFCYNDIFARMFHLCGACPKMQKLYISRLWCGIKKSVKNAQVRVNARVVQAAPPANVALLFLTSTGHTSINLSLRSWHLHFIFCMTSSASLHFDNDAIWWLEYIFGIDPLRTDIERRNFYGNDILTMIFSRLCFISKISYIWIFTYGRNEGLYRWPLFIILCARVWRPGSICPRIRSRTRR